MSRESSQQMPYNTKCEDVTKLNNDKEFVFVEEIFRNKWH